MVLNPDLIGVLDQTCDVFRPAETYTAGVTKKNLAVVSTGLACHVQIKPQGMARGEVDMPYGQEERGSHWLFLHSTEDVALSDYIAVRTGPFSGDGFWLKNFVDDTDVPGIEHICADLSLAQQSTAEVV